jgi:hypothetical protein
VEGLPEQAFQRDEGGHAERDLGEAEGHFAIL